MTGPSSIHLHGQIEDQRRKQQDDQQTHQICDDERHHAAEDSRDRHIGVHRTDDKDVHTDRGRDEADFNHHNDKNTEPDRIKAELLHQRKDHWDR